MKLTKLELELMNLLWDAGRASVREIQESLPENKRPAYTTVQTIIYRLEEKGAVQRVKKVGNAHIFEATVKRSAIQRRLIRDLLDSFGGSVQPIMTQLVEIGKLTLADLKKLEEALEKSAKDSRKTSSEKSSASEPKNKRGKPS